MGSRHVSAPSVVDQSGALASRFGRLARSVGLLAVLLFACLLCVVGPAQAQIEQGHLTGRVTDAQGGVLPGVTVTATSPALIASQTTVTSSNGRYQFPPLPPGTYAVAFDLSGFRTFQQTGISLTVGTTLTINAKLQVASVKENVTVSGAAPVVDISTTKVGTTLTAAKLQSVPSSTDIWGVIAQAQGVRMANFDVGGSAKALSPGSNSFGEKQQQIFIDGVEMTNANYPDVYSDAETEVSDAGGDVEVTSPGETVMQTVKSGGNSFHGLENITYEPGSFVGNNVNAATAAKGFTGQPNLLYWELHTDLGGYLRKNKLWFFTAYNHFTIHSAISGVPQSVATSLGIFNDSTTKITFHATSKDTFIGYYQYGKKDAPYRGLSATTSPESLLGQFSPYFTNKAEWQRVWTNRLFTDVFYSNGGYHWPMQPLVNPSTHPPAEDLGTGEITGAGWNAFLANRSRPNIVAKATYYLPTKNHGSHDLKVGYTYDDLNDALAQNGTSGPIRYLNLNGQPYEIQFADVGTPSTFGSSWKANADHDTRIAVYAQDRWTASNKLTLQLGLRYEYQRPWYAGGKRNPIETAIFQAITTPGATVFRRSTFSPRLGVNYALDNSGKTVLKAFYGRYYQYYDVNLAGSVDPGGTNYKTFIYKGALNNYQGPQDLGALISSSGGRSTKVDPNMKSPYVDEITFSIDHQFWGESSIHIGYVRTMNRNQYATYNISRAGQFTVPVSVPVTIQNYGSSTTTSQTFNLMTIPSSLVGVVNNITATLPDGGYGNYDTIDVAFQKQAGKGFVQTSFDYQFVNDLMNATNPSAQPTTANPISTGYFQNVYPTVPNRQRFRDWEARLLGHYNLPYGIGIGANVQIQSGFPYSRIITAVVPNLGAQRFFMSDLSNNTSPTVALFSLRFQKTFAITRRYRILGAFDVYNITNANTITNFVLTNGANYGEVVNALNPRTAELTLRFEF